MCCAGRSTAARAAPIRPPRRCLSGPEIPDDLHAWTKVYSGTDINKYAPFTSATSFCNVSTGTTGGWTTATTTTSGVNSTPVIRTASGAWGDWAATAKAQCLGQQSPDDGGNVAPVQPQPSPITRHAYWFARTLPVSRMSRSAYPTALHSSRKACCSSTARRRATARSALVWSPGRP